MSLLSALYNLFFKIITNRITRTLDENQIYEQARFRSNFTTMEHLQTMHQLISTDSSKEHEVKWRISNGWHAFGKALSIFKSKLPSSLKRCVHNQYIIPMIIYGSETLSFTQKLKLMQQAHVRISLGYKLKDQKHASWTQEQAKLNDLVQTTKSAKWKWTGHAQRLTGN